MKKYNVSFERNGVYQTNIVETDKSPADIEAYYKNKKKTNVFGVNPMTQDDVRPGKPVVRI